MLTKTPPLFLKACIVFIAFSAVFVVLISVKKNVSPAPPSQIKIAESQTLLTDQHFLPNISLLKPPSKPIAADTNSNWKQAVMENIEASEYFIRYQPKVQSYQSPNRFHNFRASYKPGTFELVPREDSLEKWTFHLNLNRISFNNKAHYFSNEAAVALAHENTLAYKHGELFTEQYINNKDGIRQNFIIHQSPLAQTNNIKVQLKGSGSLFAELNNDEIQLYEKMTYGKENRIIYKDLKCWDKNGKALESHFELSCPSQADSFELNLCVNTIGAEFPVTIDPVSTTASIQLESNQASANYGNSVSSAGDVNGDGYSDVIVGAYYYDNGQSEEGAAFIYHGSASGISSTIQRQLESNQANAFFGQTLSVAGDVNADGYSDIIVGSGYYDNGQTDEGVAFVYHGSSTGIGASVQTQLEVNQANAYFALNTKCAGDVNNDGYSDVIVGSNSYSNGQSTEGAAFVFHGSSTGITTTIQTQLEKNQANASFGSSVASAGDVNGDGYSDVIVAALNYSNGESNEGGVFIYHGSSSGITTTIQSQMESNQANAYYGHIVSSAGDVNGDGYSDVIVGSRYYDNGHTDEGAVFVFHGSASGINITIQRQLESNLAYAYFGTTASSAGDVNGDGYGDIVVGADFYANGEVNEGAAFVYHGSSTGISATIQSQLECNQSSAYFGNSVASAGDVNGDGYSDVIVGAIGYDNGQSNEGAAWVYHGAPTGLSSTPSTTVRSGKSSGWMGSSVSCAGDVNGDGYSDVLVGAMGYDNGQSQEGAAFVYHGSSTRLATSATTQLESNQATAYFGTSVSGAGDVNGDGYSDVICGAYYYDNGSSNEGAAFVYHGSSSGVTTTIRTQLESNQADANFGYAVAGAGDVNADGYNDVIVGAPYYDNGSSNEGAAFVYHGSSSGIGTTIKTQLEVNQVSAYLGYSVAGAGDVNGDGYSDVISGAIIYDNGQSDEGAAFVYHGSSTGITTTIRTQLEADQGGAEYGYAVSSAGDVNGDGYSDVVVSTLQYTNGQVAEGSAYVYHGSSTGITTTVRLALEYNQANANFGSAVSSAGDINGDGYSDIIVGANRYANGSATEGSIFVFHGSSAGVTSTIQMRYETNFVSGYVGQSVASAGDVNGDGFSDIVTGAEYFDAGVYINEGAFYIFQGNGASSNKRNNMKLYNTDLTSIISQTNAPLTTFGAGIYGKSFLGLQKAKHVWEIKGNGVAFTGSPISTSVSSTSSGSLTSLGTSGTELINTATKSAFSNHIRSRLKYDMVKAITGQVYSPWRYPPDYLSGGQFLNATPLPIELAHFEAECKHHTLFVNWATYTETNNNFFTVEYSLNGAEPWKALINLDAKGNSNAYQEYSASCSTPSDDLYLRLKQTDFDGKSEIFPLHYTNCDEEEKADLKIYPTPFSDVVFISGLPEYETVVVNVFNAAGNLVYSLSDLPNHQTLRLNLNDLAHGVYYLQVQINGEIISKKMLKE